MLFLEHSTGRNELMALTGYHAHTVQKALEALAEAGLAYRFRRCNGWVLTDRARALFAGAAQLRGGGPQRGPGATAPDDGPEQVDPADPAGADLGPSHAAPRPASDPPVHPPAPQVQSVDLDVRQGDRRGTDDLRGSSCSYASDVHGDNSGLTTKTTTTTTTTSPPATHDRRRAVNHQSSIANRKSPAVAQSGWDAAADDAVGKLLATGMRARTERGKGARDAVEAAMDGGWTPAQVRDAVDAWLAYAESPQGASIQHKGFFAAAQLRDLVPPPAVEQSREERARAYITRAYAAMQRR
jgi:hypothetical protein